MTKKKDYPLKVHIPIPWAASPVVVNASNIVAAMIIFSMTAFALIMILVGIYS